MVINNQVRNEVVNILANGGLRKIKFFHNGRKTFHDLEDELPAVCVFIDESECDELTTCEDEWEPAETRSKQYSNDELRHYVKTGELRSTLSTTTGESGG